MQDADPLRLPMSGSRGRSLQTIGNGGVTKVLDGIAMRAVFDAPGCVICTRFLEYRFREASQC